MKLGSQGPCFPDLTAGAAIAPNLRVKLSTATAGQVELCGDEDGEIGATENRSLKEGDDIRVRDRNSGGYHALTASEAISLGAEVFADASGKIAASGTRSLGFARESATGDGDVILVART